MKLEEGLKIQAEQLAEWKTKLSAKCYQALKEYTEQQNQGLDPTRHSGFAVTRGAGLEKFILNWKPAFGYIDAYNKIYALALNHLGNHPSRRMVALIKNVFCDEVEYKWALTKVVREHINTEEKFDQFMAKFNVLRVNGRLLRASNK